MCLIYELASNGSLDVFWKDDEGRMRLSNPTTRIKIAHQVATVLRYMHEGLDQGLGRVDVCYHRDIKSGNICLRADFTALVIDCGLSKYVIESEESFSSAGVMGTKGYICPEYNEDDTTFVSACDVFSFGVFLCELITGKTSVLRAQHSSVYETKKSRKLIDDIDQAVDWQEEIVDRFVALASACIKPTTSERPPISEVVKELQDLLAMSEPSDKPEPSGSAGPFEAKCRTCGVTGSDSIQCSGGTHQHIHCSRCMEGNLKQSFATVQPHVFRCLKEGCDSQGFRDDEVMELISTNAWNTFLYHRHFEQVLNQFDKTNDRIDTSLKLQAQLCAGNGLRCPRLFILVEAEKPDLSHPREWVKNQKSVKLYLYFVCSHSNEVVSEEAKIKLRCTRDWLKKIAPALNLSLGLLQIAGGILGKTLPFEKCMLNEMDEWVNDLLEPKAQEILSSVRSGGRALNSSDVQELVGPARSLLAERAAENLTWQSELTEAYDFEKKEATFIKARFQGDGRYQQWHTN